MIALNAAFDQQLLLADEGYESGSDTINLPTPLRKMPRIHHVSDIEHALFDPEPVTPWNHYELHPDQYTDDCCLVHQMMTTPQGSLHQFLEQLQQVLQNT